MIRQQPDALMSYTRFDDEQTYSYLTTFCEKLSGAVYLHTAQPFHIFQDIEDIKWGQPLAQSIDQTLAAITFLIPILTPSFFKNESCRYELEQFLQREARLGRNDLILPVYYINVPALEDPAKRADDPLVQTIAARNYIDWRDLRFERFESPQVQRMLAKMAEQIVDALERGVMPERPASTLTSIPPTPVECNQKNLEEKPKNKSQKSAYYNPKYIIENRSSPATSISEINNTAISDRNHESGGEITFSLAIQFSHRNQRQIQQRSTDPVLPPPLNNTQSATSVNVTNLRYLRHNYLLLVLITFPLLIIASSFAVQEWPAWLPVIVSPTSTITATDAPVPATTTIPQPTATDRPPVTATVTPPVTAMQLPAWIPAMVEIPAGSFLMGSSDNDKLADDNEKPQHQLTLDTYWIGKTEVTNTQFRPFVEGDGYTNPDYWTDTGWKWREAADINHPLYWEDTEWNSADQPVVGISWFEAVAYNRWLSAQTGHDFRLPTEAEWEKAARGPDGRIWPWGNEWAVENCNCDNVIGRTMPVGSYPDGNSFYGVLDMAGNSWEWTTTQWQEYPYTLNDEWIEAYLAGDARRVLRGGSWSTEHMFVRGAFYVNLSPRARNDSFGLRVASDSPPPGSEE